MLSRGVARVLTPWHPVFHMVVAPANSTLSPDLYLVLHGNALHKYVLWETVLASSASDAGVISTKYM